MPGVKNQHYVPRFYLRSFTNESSYLSVVRRDAGGLKPVFRTKPENVCAENYLYEVRRRQALGEDGFVKKGVIEGTLGKLRTILLLPTDRCSVFLTLKNCQKVKSASS